MEMANSLEEMHAQITQSHLLVKEVEHVAGEGCLWSLLFVPHTLRGPYVNGNVVFPKWALQGSVEGVGRTPRLHRELIINASGETGVSDF